MSRIAIILLSGGLDSATALAIAKDMGYACHAISFDYGQRHNIELACAKKQAELQGVETHRIIGLDPAAFRGSALTDDVAVPKHATVDDIAPDIPITYVPARNTIFLSYALGLAETLGAFDIFLGVNAVDYSGYPDCRPEFIESYQQMANLALAACVKGEGTMQLHTPLIDLTKAEIIRRGAELGVDYSQTSSCYDPIDGKACGHCDSCLLRKKGFEEAGLKDVTRYA